MRRPRPQLGCCATRQKFSVQKFGSMDLDRNYDGDDDVDDNDDDDVDDNDDDDNNNNPFRKSTNN
jgi:hypothetical protein